MMQKFSLSKIICLTQSSWYSCKKLKKEIREKHFVHILVLHLSFAPICNIRTIQLIQLLCWRTKKHLLHCKCTSWTKNMYKEKIDLVNLEHTHKCNTSFKDCNEILKKSIIVLPEEIKYSIQNTGYRIQDTRYRI